MALRHTELRLGLATLPALLVTALLAGCGGSTGVHTQVPTSNAPLSSTGSSPTTSGPTSSGSQSKSPSGIPTPTVTPPAQSAAAAYIGFQNALYAALSDPKHADVATLNQYLSPSAQKTYDGLIRQQAAAGQVWRGAPPTPRLKVISATASAAFMTSCPLISKTDPGREYDVVTGKPVPVPSPAVPPPYLETLTMTKVGGHWTLTMENQNRGKTCTA